MNGWYVDHLGEGFKGKKGKPIFCKLCSKVVCKPQYLLQSFGWDNSKPKFLETFRWGVGVETEWRGSGEGAGPDRPMGGKYSWCVLFIAIAEVLQPYIKAYSAMFTLILYKAINSSKWFAFTWSSRSGNWLGTLTCQYLNLKRASLFSLGEMVLSHHMIAKFTWKPLCTACCSREDQCEKCLCSLRLTLLDMYWCKCTK